MNIGIDLDGTIITCKDKQLSLLLAKAKPYGINLDFDFIWKLKRAGLNNREILKKMVLCDKITEEICVSWENEIEYFPWLYFDKLIKGALCKLEEWNNNGHTIHLISARNDEKMAYQQLIMLRINKIFQTINFVSPKQKNAKSAIFQMLNLECYIGDTENDILSTNIAKIKSFSVLTGMRDKSFFLNINATNIFSSIADINLS